VLHNIINNTRYIILLFLYRNKSFILYCYYVPLDHILYAYIFLLWSSKLYYKRNTIRHKI